MLQRTRSRDIPTRQFHAVLLDDPVLRAPSTGVTLLGDLAADLQSQVGQRRSLSSASKDQANHRVDKQVMPPTGDPEPPLWRAKPLGGIRQVLAVL